MDSTQTPSDQVAARVRSLRKAQGMQVADLAARCADLGMPELTAQALWRLEGRRPAPSGKRRPVTVDELFVLARALGVTVGELLLGGIGPMSPEALRKLADFVELSGAGSVQAALRATSALG